jgi:hypothetical protein
MSVSVRRFGTLTLAGLVGLGALVAPENPAQAQFFRRSGTAQAMSVNQQSFNNLSNANVNPNPMIAPGLSLGQFSYNTAVIGRTYAQIPPYVLGYNPYPQYVNYGPSYPSISPYGGYGLGAGYGGGYGLGTGGGYGAYAGSPYAGGYVSAGGYGSGGYGMSTMGGYGYGGGYGGVGGVSYQNPYGTMAREQSRQMAIDTRRKTLQEAADYERMRPTALTVLEKEQKTDLAMARNFATSQSIWSAKALNDLLKALRMPGRRLNAGPNIPLDEDLLKHIHLTDGSVKGNPGLLTNGGELDWPAPLRAGKFDEARTKFKQKFRSAIDQLSKDKEPVDQPTLNDLRTNLKTLNETLAASSEDMSPSQYIEARRFLNQLNDAIRALEDSKAVNYFNDAWKARGKNVAELVENMNGLLFAPAGPQDHAAYNALYQALRSFEAGMPQVVSTGR